MNKLFGKSNKTCKTIEKLIVKKDIYNLTEDEIRTFDEHIQKCESCKQYVQLISSIKKEMQLDIADEIVTDPQTEGFLLKKFENLNTRKSKNTKKMSQVFWDMFSIKIPLYKAVAGGLAAIILTFFLAYHKPYDNIVVVQNDQSIIALVDTNDIHFNTVKSLHILENQKIGRSLVEDSVLARLSHYSM